jgi:hypothetical protein
MVNNVYHANARRVPVMTALRVLDSACVKQDGMESIVKYVPPRSLVKNVTSVEGVGWVKHAPHVIMGI